MTIGARTAAWSGEKLPYDREVEYLSANEYGIYDGVYIDLGIVASADFCQQHSIEVEFSSSTKSGGHYVFGAGSSYRTGVNLSFDGGSMQWVYGDYYDTGYADWSLNTKYKAVLSSAGLSLNGNLISTKQSTTETFVGGTMLLFKERRNDAPICVFMGKIYSFKIAGLMDLIPVVKNNVGYMYDRISGNLFGNVGTGSFIVGPDVSAYNGGGCKLKCPRRSYRRSSRPSARFRRTPLTGEVAA